MPKKFPKSGLVDRQSSSLFYTVGFLELIFLQALSSPCVFPASNSMSPVAFSVFIRFVIRWHSSCCRSRHACSRSVNSFVLSALLLLGPHIAINITETASRVVIPAIHLKAIFNFSVQPAVIPNLLSSTFDTIKADIEPASSACILVTSSFNTFICSNSCELSDTWCLVTYWNSLSDKSSNFSINFIDARCVVACCSSHSLISMFHLYDRPFRFTSLSFQKHS